MYSSILVPIALDHTGRSAQAIKAAKQLVDKGGSVTFLHVLEEIPGYASNLIPENVFAERQREAEVRMKEIAKEVGDNAKPVVLWGPPSSSILNYAKEHDADCIVIASHRPGLQDYFLGSTAARVVRHAGCCVHVLR